MPCLFGVFSYFLPVFECASDGVPLRTQQQTVLSRKAESESKKGHARKKDLYRGRRFQLDCARRIDGCPRTLRWLIATNIHIRRRILPVDSAALFLLCLQ